MMGEAWYHSAECRRHDPEWWVGNQRGLGPLNQLAVHICVVHCPVRSECGAAVQRYPEYVAGTIRGGVFYVGTAFTPVPRRGQPKPTTQLCPMCPPSPPPVDKRDYPPLVLRGGEWIGYIESRLQLVRALRRAGMTYPEIAEEIGASKEGVGAACRRHGIEQGPRPKRHKVGART